MKKVICVIGARPQFIKHAPLELANSQFREDKLELITVHTGQHYDENMSQVFFDEFKIPNPNYMLDIGSHSHGTQTALMMIEIEKVILKENPEAVLVYGDTNSTIAGALVSAKMGIPIIHVESGLRSYNRSMPEEINRVLTDQLSTVLFAPNVDSVENLRREGIVNGIHVTGDLMCDMIHLAKEQLEHVSPLIEEPYYLATIHRPYNTDCIERLLYVLENLNNLYYKVVLPLHPRTRNILKKNKTELNDLKNIIPMDPVSYFKNVSLMMHSKGIITDSGGMQKEAYLLKKKCVTIRKETEWKETLLNGWNTLLFEKLDNLEIVMNEIPGEHYAEIYGDGQSANQILDILRNSC